MYLVNNNVQIEESEALVMDKKRIAVFGLSANPPGVHHRRIVELLSQKFDQVIVVPCGPRPDKETTNDIPPIHRAVMTDLTFQGLNNVRVDLTDLEQTIFTRSIDLIERYADEGEVWLGVGSDLIVEGHTGESAIQKTWEQGGELWSTARFAVTIREGYQPHQYDFPSHFQVIDCKVSGSSTEIRERIFRHEPVTELVTKEVARYIERYGLYHGMLPESVDQGSILGKPRPWIVIDKTNPRAKGVAEKFTSCLSPDDADVIIVIGGDGTMLHAIREHWRRRLPFFGINVGHWGFLLNNADDVLSSENLFSAITIRQSPMLYVETLQTDGQRHSMLAFNDCWTRSINGGQAAWTEIKINGVVRLDKMVSDGALVCTAAGTTSYARAMGAIPLSVGAKEFMLVGNNVFMPPTWRPATLTPDSVVELKNLDPNKRPVEGFVDGISLGKVLEMKVRISRIAAAELAFLPQHDLAEKLIQIQFPKS